jgi:HD-GYP domain-containing protein (c-di-GMP phosphodiesterase class II)
MNQHGMLSHVSAAKTPSIGGFFLTEAGGRHVEALIEEACGTDDTLREHSLNVAASAVAVGTSLGLKGGELGILELAATVHDVGKLQVPPEILAKPGPLDEDEWQEMRRHPVRGAELLAGHVPPAVLEIVRSHHERWDGGGYPDGLAGAEIPLGARIIAVVDAFCAMLESRPYRPATQRADARRELLAQAGRQFDADCARAAYRVTAGAA